MKRSVARIIAPSTGKLRMRVDGGSFHTADSIGSSVKLTNRLTSTATTTVMPNGKKNLPTMPPMNATGTNTAQMAKVVAITARPISSVPSRAARTWSLPMPTWRTMFSRTTMASSISSPMHRLSAIMVMKFKVKPKACTAMNDEMTEIGKVSPVMMVERHECRNRKTMAMVSSAPSIKVRCRPFSEPLTKSLLA
jgi:hypothetical protein